MNVHLCVTQELRDLFSLKPEEVGASKTQADLAARHAAQRRTTPELYTHLAALRAMPNYVGARQTAELFSFRIQSHFSLTRPAASAPRTSWTPISRNVLVRYHSIPEQLLYS